MAVQARLAPIDLYKQRIEASLTAAVAGRELPVPSDSPPDRLSIDRSMAWAWLLASPGDAAPLNLLTPLWDSEFELAESQILDRAGHSRPAYAGLLAYAALQAVAASDRVLLDSQADAVTRWVDSTATDLAIRSQQLPTSLPAAEGGKWAAMAWDALALYRGGELLDDDRPINAARRAVAALTGRQRPNGAFLAATGSDNPETLWFHELQIAHAVASFGMQASHDSSLVAAGRAGRFHMEETQPDHATNQPWGLSMFLTDPSTHIMADSLLHAAEVQHPGQPDAVTLILLADALYSLRRLASAK